jgi:hypothetical protein
MIWDVVRNEFKMELILKYAIRGNYYRIPEKASQNTGWESLVWLNKLIMLHISFILHFRVCYSCVSHSCIQTSAWPDRSHNPDNKKSLQVKKGSRWLQNSLMSSFFINVSIAFFAWTYRTGRKTLNDSILVKEDSQGMTWGLPAGGGNSILLYCEKDASSYYLMDWTCKLPLRIT